MKGLVIIPFTQKVNENIGKLNGEFLIRGISCDFSYTLKDLEKYDFIVVKRALTKGERERLNAIKDKVFNKPTASKICNDKWQTYTTLEGVVNQPTTTKDYTELTYPIIVKDRFGSFGTGVFKANNETQLKNILQKHFTGKEKNVIYQQYIECNGTHYRVMCVGDEIVGATKSTATNGFKSNAHLGANVVKAELTSAMQDMVRKCQAKIKAEWVGYDLLLDNNGQLYLCEANANAYTDAFDRATHLNPTRKYVNYILEKIK